ncbi:hypothetical protein Lal_00011218 [Lupinus albus]|nr:hypothetical protein Lal_00011218 [Lupinus albus]
MERARPKFKAIVSYKAHVVAAGSICNFEVYFDGLNIGFKTLRFKVSKMHGIEASLQRLCFLTSSHMRLELYLWRYNSLKPTDEENDIFNGGLPGLSINILKRTTIENVIFLIGEIQAVIREGGW